MAILGTIIAALGVVLILLGVLAAARKVISKEGAGFAAEKKPIIDLVGLKDLIVAIATAPPWLAMVLVGAALVYFGHQLAANSGPFG